MTASTFSIDQMIVLPNIDYLKLFVILLKLLVNAFKWKCIRKLIYILRRHLVQGTIFFVAWLVHPGQRNHFFHFSRTQDELDMFYQTSKPQQLDKNLKLLTLKDNGQLIRQYHKMFTKNFRNIDEFRNEYEVKMFVTFVNGEYYQAGNLFTARQSSLYLEQC